MSGAIRVPDDYRQTFEQYREMLEYRASECPEKTVGAHELNLEYLDFICKQATPMKYKGKKENVVVQLCIGKVSIPFYHLSCYSVIYRADLAYRMSQERISTPRMLSSPEDLEPVILQHTFWNVESLGGRCIRFLGCFKF